MPVLTVVSNPKVAEDGSSGPFAGAPARAAGDLPLTHREDISGGRVVEATAVVLPAVSSCRLPEHLLVGFPGRTACPVRVSE